MAAAKNPFEKGSARWKRWNRENKSPRRVEKKVKGDDTNRRESLDKAIEGETAARVERMRNGQSSDKANLV